MFQPADFVRVLTCRSRVEIVRDVSFEGGLVALEGQQVIGLAFNDLISDRDLVADGVDGDQRSLELTGVGQVVKELGDSGDFIGAR